MQEADLEDVSPMELAKALLASMRKQQARCCSTSVMDLQSALDLDMLRSLDQISFDVVKIIRGMINLHSPVGRLPEELLLQVFANVPQRCVAHRNHEDAYPFPNMWEVKDLCPLTAVCHQWRELALASPSLWSTLLVDEDLDHPHAKHMSCARYLHRCTTGPIYVAIRSIRKGSQVLRLLDELRERVRELHVGILHFMDWSADDWGWPGDDAGPDPEGMDSHPSLFLALPRFPNLEHCSWTGDHDIDPTGPPFPNYNFCDTPKLRTLELSHPSSIPPHAYPALTHLSIIDPCSGGRSGQLMRLLSSAPQLRVLILKGLIVFGELRQRVHLPFLRYLETSHSSLTPEFEAFRNALFSSLVIPPSCTINYGPIHAEGMLPCATNLPYVYTATRLGIRRVHGTYLSVRYVETSMHFSAEKSTQSVSWRVWTVTPSEFPSSQIAPYRDTFVTPLDSLALKIRKLSIGPHCHWLWGAPTHSIVCAFPRLTFLRIHPGDPSHFPPSHQALSKNLDNILEALQIDTVGEQHQRHRGSLVCPELTRLWIDWPASVEDESPPSHGSGSHFKEPMCGRPPETVLASLRRLADARATRGHALSRVFIAYPRLRTPRGRYAYAVDEYDGSVTRILRTTELEPSGAVRDSSEERLEMLFAWEWDRVEDAGA